MSEQDAVLLEEDHAGVRVLRLNRPARKNALNAQQGFVTQRSAKERVQRDGRSFSATC